MTVGALFSNEIPHRDFGDALWRVSAEHVTMLELRNEALSRRVDCLIAERDALKAALRDRIIKDENRKPVPGVVAVKQPSGYWW